MALFSQTLNPKPYVSSSHGFVQPGDRWPHLLLSDAEGPRGCRGRRERVKTGLGV